MDPSNMVMPEGFAMPEEGIPEGYVPPSDMQMPDGMTMPGCWPVGTGTAITSNISFVA
jgi:hypothetical protein